jgi:hypothetical protein
MYEEEGKKKREADEPMKVVNLPTLFVCIARPCQSVPRVRSPEHPVRPAAPVVKGLV